ncbi:MarR family winged helix-turn-helix transcriptional regulator [Kutzneria sp. CA-103260]|uniref:MarR family winged helix-turn-helix transcriptional regulator n=1 Tax=Kutzneria sp. CA-103260 TaxID=2802641 RepID=UPI001BACDA0E|nr:MarR family transcriptional regulator [Kutzneria sp. CA-103260]QUQ66611.1 MarR family transcriptional regulator [Kutzneria sp. CA-103260]
MVDTAQALDVLELATAVLNRNFELLRRRTDAYQELDKSEYLLLRTLDQTGPADVSTLAGALGLDPSTVGRQVTGMQGRDLVTKIHDTADRRRCIIAPTEQGLELMALTRQRRLAISAELLGDWTPDELHTFAELLTRHNDAVAARYLKA